MRPTKRNPSRGGKVAKPRKTRAKARRASEERAPSDEAAVERNPPRESAAGFPIVAVGERDPQTPSSSRGARATPLRARGDLERVIRGRRLRQEELIEQNAALRRAQLELRTSNDALAQSAEQYRSLYENAPVAYLTLDCDGRIAAANRVAMGMFGGGRLPLIGRPFSDLVAPDDQDAWHRHLRALFRGRTRPIAMTLAASGRSLIHVEAMGAPGADPGSLHIALLDVTERERAAQEARQNARHVRLISDVLPVLVAYVDDDERYRFANSSYTTWFGASPAAMRGRTIRAVLGEATYAAVSEHVRAALSGQTVRFEAEIPYRSGGTRYVSVIHAPDLDEAGAVTGFYSIIHDLTPLRLAERALRAAAAEAALAEERERRALAADLHDDVGQLLSLASIELGALDDVTNAREWHALIHRVAKLVADARERVTSLSFQLSPPILHDVGLVAAAQWLADDLGRRYGLEVCVEAEDGGLAALDEALRVTLFRALRELLINVARHAGTAQANARIRVRDDQVEIEVEDRGVGFDPSARRGFGLRSVCDRVEHMGGSVHIASSPGAGTTTRVRAPVAPPERGES